MKRLLKKLTAALAAAVLIFSFLPQAFADGEALGGSADFDFVSGIYTLSIGTDDGCYMLSAENTVWLFRSNNGGTAVESIDIVTGQRREAALSYNAADFAFKLSVLDGARLCVTASGMTRDEFYIEIFSPSCERESFLRYGAVPTESVVPNDGKQALLVLGKHRLLIADLETGELKTRFTFRNAFDVSVEYLEKNGLKVGREQDYIWENLRVYSAKTGALIKDYSESPLASERIISCMTDSGKVAAYSRDGTFYLADPFAEVLEGEAAIYYSALPDTETGAVARRLFLERGVEIFWGAMHCDISPFCAYDYVPATDGGETLGAVRKIESFINSLPEGMISELLMNDMTRLRFYLLDELSYAGVRYSGYTVKYGSFMNITVNTGWNASVVSDTIVHEFFHALRHRPEEIELLYGTPVLSSWFSLMPEQVRGLYYAELSADQWFSLYDKAYTAEGGGDDDSVWFARAYSRLDSSEDMATLFEAMCGENGGETLKYTHLNEKARYLAVIIRLCYPSCTDAPPLPWERNISVDPHEFDGIIFQ